LHDRSIILILHLLQLVVELIYHGERLLDWDQACTFSARSDCCRGGPNVLDKDVVVVDLLYQA
jgi:hypothetical protein